MKLKELRKAKKITQQEFAKEFGLPLRTYNAYENGEYEPSIETLIKLADFYDVSLDFLCERRWQNQLGYIPDNKRELVKLILQLNELNTMRAISYISGMLAIQNN